MARLAGTHLLPPHLRRDAARRRARRRSGRRGHYPRAIEREYARLLLAIARRSAEALRPLIAAALERHGEDLDDRARAAGRRVDGLESDLNEAVLQAQSAAGTALEKESLERLAEQVDAFTTADTKAQASIVAKGSQDKKALGALLRLSILSDVPAATLSTWVAGNLQLATSIAPTYYAQVSAAIIEAVTESKGSDWLAAEIVKRGKVAESRARLIARNEVGTLYSQITAERQQAIGISRYRWSTSQDERVRPEHEAIDGQIFTWAEGAPGEGHPGEPIGCRCVAIPVLD